MITGRFVSAVLFSILVPLLAVALGGAGDVGTQYLITLILIWSLFAIGFDLVFGVAGILSFGHAAFFGCGAYCYAILTLDYGMSGLPALALAVMLGSLLATLFGAIALRVNGVFVALTTLALAQLIHHLIEVKLKNITGGTDGLAGVPRPDLWGINFYDDWNYLVLVAGLFLLASLANAVIRHSPFGEVLRAVRQSETRAQQLGYDIRLYKVAAFGISGAYAGLAGGLLGALMMFVGPDMTRWTTSGDVLIMTVLGGRGTFAGPVLGVVLFETLKESASALSNHWYGVLGITFVLVTLFMPGGVASLGAAIFRRFWNKAEKMR
ncbi:MAG TPA: branched-chain amino acid ABC transporter permease [Rhodospirillaceae bacterium]|nr:branched-chain amino acid ABC transporter permease [Rhodospirillaceae bacterium]MAX62391.1 branched-chain amino acid ABC transporter permease [Rhodospirillaceae bacterium]MBB56220.1 branched-chain amino acid ABC transporter permease [Rhodospirillaceae bacterium]HAJ21606.1 branched-chain amino acid ABC transporter permease [Rhodospirillaceae bacterium]HBM12994.1 branched-chain amino acid ABC transporter permease [Rhodospirillaceae bacterium]|tara:strand:+ start:264 stop:1232 length:969 start_codon:yes stop_codon:yes gene_type:complete